ncbi:small multi-drug export protein [Patescibacteria group bacterium]|nr:small multi-drug export protein [Patescibacteria group bacterium]MBU4458457.1 small multi-drug export protein [Patescibacteria group bacterium]MCG2695987.1 small multi-drug export protein [Candidatus Portnoybacteria bacterium]
MNIPHELIVVGIAAIPIGELRVAIPVAMVVYKMSVWSAFLWSLIGNLIPIVFIILGLDLLINRFAIHRIYFLNKFFNWLFEKTRKKHTKIFERWQYLALTIFVAIPLPGTGAWTGSLIAYVFGIPLKRAFPAIAAGVLIAGILVSLITLGIINLPLI